MPADVIETPAAGTPTGTPAAAVPPAAPPAPPVVPPVAAAVPEKYTLALPENSPLSAAALERVSAAAKSLKVADDAGAQALVALAHGEAAEVLTTWEAARAPGGVVHKQTVEKYEADALKHAQLGNGDPVRFKQVQQQIGLVLGKYGTEGLAADIQARGYMTPNEMLFLSSVYKAQGESAFVTGSAPVTPASSLATRFAGDVDKHLAAAGIIPNPK